MRLLCIGCRCEIESVDIARGRIVAICLTCDAYGDAAELAAGVRLNAAQPLPPRLRLVQSLPLAKRAKATEPQRPRVNRRAAAGSR
jgi:hypothetical protein